MQSGSFDVNAYFAGSEAKAYTGTHWNGKIGGSGWERPVKKRYE